MDPDREVRVIVHQWLVTEPIEEQYVEYPKKLWLLFHYWQRFGMLAVLRKIRSRLAESKRNRKIGGLGIGQIVEQNTGCGDLQIGTSVIFFAPNNYEDEIDVVVPHDFVMPLCGSEFDPGGSFGKQVEELPNDLKKYLAWTAQSGHSVDTHAIRSVLGNLALLCSPDWGSQSIESLRFTTRISGSVGGGDKPSAVLFGLGNYAKTQIIPNISNALSLERIHEIDPMQFHFLSRHHSAERTTCPHALLDRQFDAWFIAGYHHTHAPLATEAIRQGAYAVIEKPLATKAEDLSAFLSAVETHEMARFFLCFHKRYSQLNSFVKQDISHGPVDMHAIVYEIPLPKNHWYNWPNSGSRLLSNGCHWLDYFMWVNGYAQAISFDKWCPRGSDVMVQVQLENGAYLNLSLTEEGSQRLGMREYIELRQGGITISITDGYHFRSETRNRVIRNRTVNRLEAYSAMYNIISRKIANGESGDSRDSLRSSELAIQLEMSLSSQSVS